MDLGFNDPAVLDQLRRKELQGLAKRHKIKANAKTVVLIVKLQELYAEHYPEGTDAAEPEPEPEPEPTVEPDITCTDAAVADTDPEQEPELEPEVATAATAMEVTEVEP